MNYQIVNEGRVALEAQEGKFKITLKPLITHTFESLEESKQAWFEIMIQALAKVFELEECVTFAEVQEDRSILVVTNDVDTFVSRYSNNLSEKAIIEAVE